MRLFHLGLAIVFAFAFVSCLSEHWYYWAAFYACNSMDDLVLGAILAARRE